MKKFVIALALAAAPLLTQANSGQTLPPANVDVSDQASLQRGAKIFVNYCLSCHSANYMRYNRMGRDLGLTDEQVSKNLMLASEKIGETMSIAMTVKDGKKWFGNPPPDLSVIARARGADYLYNYFTTFYLDDKRPFGVNNLVFKDVGMPHVLWELEGTKRAVFDNGNFKHFEPVTAGKMSAAEYDQAARDLTNFLVYMGEPIQLERQRIGVWVLLFLGIFFVIAYLLKKEYWRDIH